MRRGWDGLAGAGAGLALTGADVAGLGRGAALAADRPRSWPVARTPGTAALVGSPEPSLPTAGPAAGMPLVPASAIPSGRPGTAAAPAAAGLAFAGAALALAGAAPSDGGAVLAVTPVGSPVTGGRLPLSTKPAMPWSANGAAEEWALMVRPGSESAAMVARAPPE